MYTPKQKTALLEMAWQTLKQFSVPSNIRLKDYDTVLQQDGACFVTLYKQDGLRGCIGSLQATEPLIFNVANNAFKAAFQDQRFLPLTPGELHQLSLSISVLTPASELYFCSEAELLSQIRPNVDGLILKDTGHSATFLPIVWQSLPTVEMFWTELKQKAGLPINYWSQTLQVYRYTTVLIE